MDKLLVAAIKVEKVLREIGETTFEPLKDERDEEANESESPIKQQTHVLNDTLIKNLKDQATRKSSYLEV
jgi:hypothetical protein